MMQPQFLPWLGYLELVATSDTLVPLDDFQLSRNSWHTRNRLFSADNRTSWVTLDLDRSNKSSPRATFRSTREHEDGKWRVVLVRLLRGPYQKSPFWRDAAALVDEWTAVPAESVAERHLQLLKIIVSTMSFETELVCSSSLKGQVGVRSVRVQSILKAVGGGSYLCAAGSVDYMLSDGNWDGHDVWVQQHVPIPYRQSHSETFVPGLAFLDALANVG